MAADGQTAIVTGGAKRIGAALVRALAADGWHVLIHYHRIEGRGRSAGGGDRRRRRSQADLADPGAAETIIGGAGRPAAGAAAGQQRLASSRMTTSAISRRRAGPPISTSTCARRPCCRRAFAARAGRGADRQPARRQARRAQSRFLQLHHLQDRPRRPHRAYAPAPSRRSIRVCGIAPSVTLVSGPQSRANFDKVHGLNALGRGVDGRGDRRRAALHHRHAEHHRPDDPARRRPAFPLPAARRAVPGALNDAEYRPARRPRARPARAEDAQDRARGLRPARRHRLPRFRGRQRRSGCWSRSRSGSTSAASPPPTSAASAWDYDFLRTEIGALADGRRFNLQETFVREIYDLVAARRGVTALRVSTRKPDIYPDCAGVGVELTSAS